VFLAFGEVFLVGLKVEIGSVGPLGPVGPQGTTGSQGLQGQEGFQGYQGSVGPVGPQGSQGSQGNSGLQGYQGSAGTTGPQGYQGSQGATGVIGPTGLSGSSVITDIQANRPSAELTGRIFYPTDGSGIPDSIQIDNGSGWDTLVNGFKCTPPPVVNTFISVGAGSETSLVAEGDNLILTQNGVNSSSCFNAGYLKELPAPPYTLTVGLSVSLLYPLDNTFVGVMLSNGTSDPYHVTYRCWQTHGSNQQLFEIVKYSALNTEVAAYSGFPVPVFPPLLRQVAYFRLQDDTTNRVFSVSQDCKTWMQVQSVSRTDWLIPTHVGLVIGQDLNAVATTIVRSQMRIFHWYFGT
jgi:hypothetical protein